MSRTVQCAKLGGTLPGLPYKPFNDALGQRIYDNISAQAWQEWEASGEQEAWESVAGDGLADAAR